LREERLSSMCSKGNLKVLTIVIAALLLLSIMSEFKGVYAASVTISCSSKQTNNSSINLGTIIFEPETTPFPPTPNLPRSINRVTQTLPYQATFYPPSGYVIDHWEFTGSINVPDAPYAMPLINVYLTGSGAATLTAVYKQVSAPPGDVRVTVKNSDGSPLTPDTIGLYNQNWQEVNRVTPISNVHTFVGNAPGTYNAEAYCYDMFVGSINGIVVTSGGIGDGTIQAQWTKKPLYVDVYYSDGTTRFPGATLKVYSWDGHLSQWNLRDQGTSSNSGPAIFSVWPTTISGEKYKIETSYNLQQVAPPKEVTVDKNSGTTTSLTTNVAAPIQNNPSALCDYPSQNAQLVKGSTQRFTTSVSDLDGDLNYVDFYFDDQTWTTHVLVSGSSDSAFSEYYTFSSYGTHKVKAMVYDSRNDPSHYGRCEWDVTVGFDPTISRSSPTESSVSVTQGNSQTFTANVADFDSDLSTVKWFLQDQLQGTRLVSGNSALSSWLINFPSSGTYTVEAEVFDGNPALGHSQKTHWDVTVNSVNYQTISFSGYSWEVKQSESPMGPGGNYWSNNMENVRVDENGYLHLKLTYRNGKWYCPEISTIQTLGYGTYTFYANSRIDSLDKNVVLGLFAYKDDNHEVDIELTKWGNSIGNNGWFTVQPPPYIAGQNQKSFNIQLTGDYSTHSFEWTQYGTSFKSIHGHYSPDSAPQENIIQSFVSTSNPNAEGAKAHINLWLLNANPPSNGENVEVIISQFEFIPPGSLRVYVRDNNNQLVTGARVSISGVPSQVTGIDGFTDFAGLAYDVYEVKVFHQPEQGLNFEEYWGSASAAVSGNSVIFFHRQTQRVTEIHINGVAEGSWPVSAVTEISNSILIKIANDESVGKNVKIRLILDRSQSSPYDFDLESSIKYVSSGLTTNFEFNVPLSQGGIYYLYAVIYTEGTSNFLITDQYNWVNAASVQTTELNSLSDIVKSLLPDCSSNNPIIGKSFSIKVAVHYSSHIDAQAMEESVGPAKEIIEDPPVMKISNPAKTIVSWVFDHCIQVARGYIEEVLVFGANPKDQAFYEEYGLAPFMFARGANDALWPEVGSVIQISGTVEWQLIMDPSMTVGFQPVLVIQSLEIVDESISLIDIIKEQVTVGQQIKFAQVIDDTFSDEGLLLFQYSWDYHGKNTRQIYLTNIDPQNIPLPGSLVEIQGTLQEPVSDGTLKKYYVQATSVTVLAGKIVDSEPSLKGRVRDSTSGLFGAVLNLGPFSTISNSDGYFSLPELESGTYTLTVSRDYYNSQEYEIIITRGITILMDIQLLPTTPPEPTIAGPLSVSFNPNEEREIPIVVSNLGGACAEISHVSISVSNGLEITSWRSSASIDLKNYPIGSLIWSANRGQIVSTDQLLEGYFQFESNQPVTIFVTVRAKGSVDSLDYIKYRTTMYVCNTLWENAKYQDPINGNLDQQDFFAKTISTNAEVQFDFAIASSVASRTATVGASVAYPLTVSLLGGSVQSVSLSCSPAIVGVSYQFVPQVGNPMFLATMTAQTSTSTPPGTYTLTIAGSGDGKTSTTTVELVVQAQPSLYTLTVASAHGSPEPSVGSHSFSSGSSVICSVVSPVTENGVTYTCTGWVGTGSIASSGSGLSTSISITQDSSITWNWVASTLSEFTLSLKSGWNMVSFPVIPQDTRFTNIFSGISFYQVITWTGTNYVSPSNVEAGKGY
jgi:hypothetical protein